MPGQAEAVRLTHCLGGAAPEDLRLRVTAYARREPDRVHASLPDFLAAALGEVCPDR